MKRLLRLLPLLACPLSGGCALAYLAGGMMQNAEYQKQVQVLPKYDGLVDQRVAVLVDADLDILYDHPDLVGTITSAVTKRIGANVPGTKMLREDLVLGWQWRTPQWNAMPYGDIAASLGVNRIVLIDITEYRLNPPGNRWLWEGVCAANVQIIEGDGVDPDLAVGPFTVVGEFPAISNVDRSAASARDIETGVLAEFIKKTTWLFHEHLEPKYPDKFRPELEQPS